MKTMIPILLPLLIASSASAGANFRCFAPRNADNPFLGEGYALVTVNEKSLRFKHYDTYTGRPVLLRDYVYSYEGINRGNGRAKGMMTFKLQKEVKPYGDSIGTLYAQTSMGKGQNGAVMFTGQGFSWDWNFCKALDN